MIFKPVPFLVKSLKIAIKREHNRLQKVTLNIFFITKSALNSRWIFFYSTKEIYGTYTISNSSRIGNYELKTGNILHIYITYVRDKKSCSRFTITVLLEIEKSLCVLYLPTRAWFLAFPY